MDSITAWIGVEANAQNLGWIMLRSAQRSTLAASALQEVIAVIMSLSVLYAPYKQLLDNYIMH